MATSRHIRFTWIAIAAFAGIVSMATDAAACGASRDRSAPERSCCVVPSTSGCCCESPAPARSVSVDVATIVPGARPMSTTGGNCRCRPADPARVPSRPASHRVEEGPDPVAVASGSGVPTIGAAASPVHRIVPHASPPSIPVYLRVSRLLI